LLTERIYWFYLAHGLIISFGDYLWWTEWYVECFLGYQTQVSKYSLDKFYSTKRWRFSYLQISWTLIVQAVPLADNDNTLSCLVTTYLKMTIKKVFLYIQVHQCPKTGIIGQTEKEKKMELVQSFGKVTKSVTETAVLTL